MKITDFGVAVCFSFMVAINSEINLHIPQSVKTQNFFSIGSSLKLTIISSMKNEEIVTSIMSRDRVMRSHGK